MLIIEITTENPAWMTLLISVILELIWSHFIYKSFTDRGHLMDRMPPQKCPLWIMIKTVFIKMYFIFKMELAAVKICIHFWGTLCVSLVAENQVWIKCSLNDCLLHIKVIDHYKKSLWGEAVWGMGWEREVLTCSSKYARGCKVQHREWNQ